MNSEASNFSASPLSSSINPRGHPPTYSSATENNNPFFVANNNINSTDKDGLYYPHQRSHSGSLHLDGSHVHSYYPSLTENNSNSVPAPPRRISSGKRFKKRSRQYVPFLKLGVLLFLISFLLVLCALWRVRTPLKSVSLENASTHERFSDESMIDEKVINQDGTSSTADVGVHRSSLQHTTTSSEEANKEESQKMSSTETSSGKYTPLTASPSRQRLLRQFSNTAWAKVTANWERGATLGSLSAAFPHSDILPHRDLCFPWCADGTFQTAEEEEVQKGLSSDELSALLMRRRNRRSGTQKVRDSKCETGSVADSSHCGASSSLYLSHLFFKFHIYEDDADEELLSDEVLLRGLQEQRKRLAMESEVSNSATGGGLDRLEEEEDSKSTSGSVAYGSSGVAYSPKWKAVPVWRRTEDEEQPQHSLRSPESKTKTSQHGSQRKESEGMASLPHHRLVSFIPWQSGATEDFLVTAHPEHNKLLVYGVVSSGKAATESKESSSTAVSPDGNREGITSDEEVEGSKKSLFMKKMWTSPALPTNRGWEGRENEEEASPDYIVSAIAADLLGEGHVDIVVQSANGYLYLLPHSRGQVSNGVDGLMESKRSSDFIPITLEKPRSAESKASSPNIQESTASGTENNIEVQQEEEEKEDDNQSGKISVTNRVQQSVLTPAPASQSSSHVSLRFKDPTQPMLTAAFLTGGSTPAYKRAVNFLYVNSDGELLLLALHHQSRGEERPGSDNHHQRSASLHYNVTRIVPGIVPLHREVLPFSVLQADINGDCVAELVYAVRDVDLKVVQIYAIVAPALDGNIVEEDGEFTGDKMKPSPTMKRTNGDSPVSGVKGGYSVPPHGRPMWSAEWRRGTTSTASEQQRGYNEEDPLASSVDGVPMEMGRGNGAATHNAPHVESQRRRGAMAPEAVTHQLLLELDESEVRYGHLTVADIDGDGFVDIVLPYCRRDDEVDGNGEEHGSSSAKGSRRFAGCEEMEGVRVWYNIAGSTATATNESHGTHGPAAACLPSHRQRRVPAGKKNGSSRGTSHPHGNSSDKGNGGMLMTPSFGFRHTMSAAFPLNVATCGMWPPPLSSSLSAPYETDVQSNAAGARHTIPQSGSSPVRLTVPQLLRVGDYNRDGKSDILLSSNVGPLLLTASKAGRPSALLIPSDKTNKTTRRPGGLEAGDSASEVEPPRSERNEAEETTTHSQVRLPVEEAFPFSCEPVDQEKAVRLLWAALKLEEDVFEMYLQRKQYYGTASLSTDLSSFSEAWDSLEAEGERNKMSNSKSSSTSAVPASLLRYRDATAFFMRGSQPGELRIGLTVLHASHTSPILSTPTQASPVSWFSLYEPSAYQHENYYILLSAVSPSSSSSSSAVPLQASPGTRGVSSSASTWYGAPAVGVVHHLYWNDKDMLPMEAFATQLGRSNGFAFSSFQVLVGLGQTFSYAHRYMLGRREFALDAVRNAADPLLAAHESRHQGSKMLDTGAEAEEQTDSPIIRVYTREWPNFLVPNSQVFALMHPPRPGVPKSGERTSGTAQALFDNAGSEYPEEWTVALYIPVQKYRRRLLATLLISLTLIGVPILYLRWWELRQDELEWRNR